MEKRKIGLVSLGAVNLLLLISILVINSKLKVNVNSADVATVSSPDQSEAMEHESFVKEEYIPVIPEGKNIAIDKKVKANGFEDVYTPRKVVDGNAEGVSYWEGKGDSYPNTLTVDLEKEETIHTIRLCLNPSSAWGKRTQEISIEASADGKKFEEIIPSSSYDFDPDTGNQVTIPLEEVKTRYVQVTFTSNTGANGGQLAEREVYKK